jgi:hypothetical protein
MGQINAVSKRIIDWRKRGVNNKLYMDQQVKRKLDKMETRIVMTGRGIRLGCCLSSVLLNLYGEYLAKEAVEDFGNIKLMGEQFAL